MATYFYNYNKVRKKILYIQQSRMFTHPKIIVKMSGCGL